MKFFDSHINKKAKELLNAQTDLKPALFLDRDGVIIKDRHYINNPDDVELESFALELIKYVNLSNWPIIVITNQSGISRELLSWKKYEEITKKMIDLFAISNPFAAIYANSVPANNLTNKLRKPMQDDLAIIKDFLRS